MENAFACDSINIRTNYEDVDFLVNRICCGFQMLSVIEVRICERN